MSTFTDSVCAAPRVNILEAVRNTYERIYRNKEFADVVLVRNVNAPSDDPVEFRAHALVLKSASVVFGAMLGSNTWSEGQGRRIDTKDSPAALDNFLSLVYTGCEPTTACTLPVQMEDAVGGSRTAYWRAISSFSCV